MTIKKPQKVIKLGGSLCITLPKFWYENFKLDKDKKVIISFDEKGRLVIEAEDLEDQNKGGN